MYSMYNREESRWWMIHHLFYPLDCDSVRACMNECRSMQCLCIYCLHTICLNVCNAVRTCFVVLHWVTMNTATISVRKQMLTLVSWRLSEHVRIQSTVWVYCSTPHWIACSFIDITCYIMNEMYTVQLVRRENVDTVSHCSAFVVWSCNVLTIWYVHVCMIVRHNLL
jgi:hypothetical protein